MGRALILLTPRLEGSTKELAEVASQHVDVRIAQSETEVLKHLTPGCVVVAPLIYPHQSLRFFDELSTNPLIAALVVTTGNPDVLPTSYNAPWSMMISISDPDLATKILDLFSA